MQAVGAARIALLKGRMRIVTYVCESCEHEWTLDESRASADDRPALSDQSPSIQVKCPSCENGMGKLFQLALHHESRSARYACHDCEHEWTIPAPVSG